jgi:ribosomal-protein-alanine N-acetyltransferase
MLRERIIAMSNIIDLQHIKLLPATLADYPTIQNMGRFYVYDISKEMCREPGWEIPADGLYECLDLKKYWEDKNAFQFIVRYHDEIVGFVFIDKKGSAPDIEFNMAQFFILARFSGQGVGRHVAFECFKQFCGTWEVMVMLQNKSAYQFWKRIISEYTKNQFEEYRRVVRLLYDTEKNIFKFSS